MFPALLTPGEIAAIPADLVLASSGPNSPAASRRPRRIGAVLAILVVTAMPYAHAQTASTTMATANVETAGVTGTVAANASMTASAATAQGIAKTDTMAIGVVQSKSDPSYEPTPFHPLTDF